LEDGPRLRAQLKKQLRGQMKAIRGALPAEARVARSCAIVARVLELAAWREAKVVAAFIAMRGEADPAALVAEALGSGRRVTLPRVDAEARELRMHEFDEATVLSPQGAYGILEPPEDAPLTPLDEVDLVLVPALVLDPLGYRIGYGGGFYDRLLPSMHNATRVAIAYDFQLLAEIPTHDHDQRVDYVVTDTRTLETGAREGAREDDEWPAES